MRHFEVDQIVSVGNDCAVLIGNKDVDEYDIVPCVRKSILLTASLIFAGLRASKSFSWAFVETQC